jgi:signal transduction histidine kinase
MQNLIANAIKFRRQGVAPAVTITAEIKDNRVMLRVKDNGIGIAKDDQARVFTIFQRLHSRDEYPGTGIGLAICKKVVNRHHGSIWIESEPGIGTSFFVALPKLLN